CEEGLRLLDELGEREELAEFYLLPAGQADLLRRLGRWSEAAKKYRRALELTTNDIERRFLRRRLVEVESVKDRKSDTTSWLREGRMRLMPTPINFGLEFMMSLLVSISLVRW